MNDLKIIIEGKALTGKTTLALHLEKILSENGFDISYQDNDNYPEHKFVAHNKEQIKRLRDNSKITILERQIPRV